MAQWRGQFSGLAHGTKLADAEATLRVAVNAFHRSEPADKETKAEAVRHLGDRVLNLRLKLLKAIRNFGPPVAHGSPLAEQLLEPERAVQAAGLVGILSEVGAADACRDGRR